jgi:hypothetical protein
MRKIVNYKHISCGEKYLKSSPSHHEHRCLSYYYIFTKLPAVLAKPVALDLAVRELNKYE